MTKYIFKNIVYKGVEISIMAYNYTEAMITLLKITEKIEDYRRRGFYFPNASQGESVSN